MNRTETIQQKILADLTCDHLLIENESHRHHVPKDSETHFKLTIVSAQFQNISRINRHRMINTLLASEFEQGLHALSLYCYTPDEFTRVKPIASPACKDGFEH